MAIFEGQLYKIGSKQFIRTYQGRIASSLQVTETINAVITKYGYTQEFLDLYTLVGAVLLPRLADFSVVPRYAIIINHI